jgi:tRNA(Ile)-lysidine synthase
MVKLSVPTCPTFLSPLRFNPEWLDAVFSAASKVWVGFSGGVDSHVLLHALVDQASDQQKLKLAALHVHHGLSANADDWLLHCESVCMALEVTYVAKRVTLEAQASIEDAARNARYQAFQNVVGEDDVVLLAHHAGDQMETVLFRLLRGSGGKGLSGIPIERRLGVSNTRIIRPLLSVPKNAIEDYAQRHQLVWIQDESNLDERFTRNFLRQRVIPILQERFPKMEQSIVSSSQRIATDYAMLSQFAEQQLVAWCNAFGGLDLSYLISKSTDERLFWWRYFLLGKGVSLPQAQLDNVDAMFFSHEDKQPAFIFPFGRLMRHQNVVYLLPEEEEVTVSPLLSGVPLLRPFDEVCVIGSDDCVLKARPNGESLRMPSGNTRKLKKWLNDHSIPSWWRDHLPYLYHGDRLVAVGDLWRHPDYVHLTVRWKRNPRLPFPMVEHD